jgi:hypothetical protein
MVAMPTETGFNYGHGTFVCIMRVKARYESKVEREKYYWGCGLGRVSDLYVKRVLFI